MRMELFFSQYTSQGGRKKNEDSICVRENYVIVADGLGGQGDGEVASKVCVDCLDEIGVPQQLDDAAMHRLIEQVNYKVWQVKEQYERKTNMATTVVAAYAKEGVFNYFNVGDSRLYYFRKHKLWFQSKDHSVTQACVDMGTIKASQMRFHEDRNKLTKALGLKKDIRIVQTFETVPMKTGDAYLLCSDGFWEYVYEKEMERCLKKAKTPQDWMQYMLRYADKRAPQNCDNRSAIGVFVL